MQQEPDSVPRAVTSRKAEKQNKRKLFWRMLMEEANGGSDPSSRGTSITCPKIRSLLLWAQEWGERELGSSRE